MKKKLLNLFINALTFIIILLTSENIFAQSMDTSTTSPEKNELTVPVFTVVEEMPEFPGGVDSLLNFITANIHYPEDAIKNNISGRVYVTFVVSSTGKIKESKILRGIGGGCDEEALRVINMMPDWQPGKQNGKTVNVQYNMPIYFHDK